MKEALLRFEVEVVELGDFEDIMNHVMVIVYVCASGNPNVVHVYPNSCAEGFMFEDNVPIDVVHHGLESRWQVGESEIHDCRFKKSVSGFKRRFLLVSFANAYIVVPPSDIKLRIDVGIAEVTDEICN